MLKNQLLDFSNLTLVLFHYCHKLVEQIRRIMRAGTCFGVILDRINRKASMTEPFDGVVVQVDVRDLAVAWKRIGIDREAMILRCDFDPPGRQVLHRLISAVMTERELVSPATKCKSH